ncbi:Recombination-associated protein RdgC [Aquicella siphonis]|uniref:Recombination-associated protein RdgC n=1 Tax=Aquicella siphonis TaxID=254247 RepID=A0A5E4PL14_9COXI|nr:recombination-associated protein RdgC [Aquicella siphonis]VVC77023.1 Recombination-associated protein RdgC [Aquicella siphonis]
MWFKQVQLFQLTSPIQSSPNALAEKLEPLAFNPCLPSMPSSAGWISPVEEEGAPLARGLNGCIMFCLQAEEKILPASVVTQTLKEKIRQIELAEGRRVRQKEKLSYKEEVTQTLLPRAFSKYSRTYAYIDTRNQWLVLNSTSPKKTEAFLSMFKKSLGDGICSIDVIKPASIVTQWLKNKDYPQAFSIEKFCVLQDPDQQNRVIRCQQQDLFDSSIQSLVKDGCEAIQIGLCWHDKLSFVMADDFSFRSIHLADDDLAEIQDEMESRQQKFDADFVMMTEMYAGLINDLLAAFAKEKKPEAVKKLAMTG